ncbi:MAG: DUF2268 domain-containing putative Zn-dependent protease [Bacteroidota bacterium]
MTSSIAWPLLFLSIFFTKIHFLPAQAERVKAEISTIDLDHFWEAYDSLATSTDSVATIQRLYLDRGSDGLKQFLKARNFTAAEYIKLIRRYPTFWPSIRPNTLAVKDQIAEIQSVFQEYARIYPKFKAPKVCFAIGCLRTGGTVRGGYLLIGTEISAADSLTEKSELNNWLKTVLPKDGDVTKMVAHESVHFLQKKGFGQVRGYFGHRLLMSSLMEGAADFIAGKAIGKHINDPIHAYGEAHEAELWKEFEPIMLDNDISNWLYNGTKSKDRPADLGYYMGYKICESYYNQAEDKSKAIIEIIEMKRYKRFLRKSGYSGS